ncbi:hypothetical protein EOI86_10400 [Hwanghaeella grinnelliae]|uniref:Spore protein YkvP/CgeB glycosyl transferase-like domain-containing protein n=1 Tax=Hwanghaeella grinnelliae TaxID=2500179 RepID=A0A3S2WD21_9PROT|nr:hypothetical protein [Hwanghaeella grinnelliae]RVU39610.1 hypothetical protein EOI86_10400 [Hwanghaeella grinnelliae]
MNQSAQDAFERADYQAAARLADDPILKGLALVMIGNPLDGLPLLSGTDPADRQVPAGTAAILAFGHWLGGNTAEARTILSARREDRLCAAFLDLLKDEPIPCLFQTARAPLLSSCKQVDGFAVTTVGSSGQDCDIALDDCDNKTLGNTLDEAAFLFGFDFAGPPPLRAPGNDTPYLIHLTDPDVHVLTGLHPVRDYDRAIAGTSGQAAMLRAITGTPTASGPLFGGLSAFHPSLADFGPAPDNDRKTDLFFSGSYGTPIYHEKPARFFAVSQVPEAYRIDLFDSTRPLSDYAAGLQSARFALVSVRAPGSFSTRAMQALECGAFVLCEADSGVLDYFPGEDWGVFTYRPDHITEDIAAHLARYDDYAERLRTRWGAIRQRLSALSPGSPAAEERWLKYAAFQSLLIRHGGRPSRRPRSAAAPLDWFTVRGLPAPAHEAPWTTRSAGYTDLAVKARGATPPAEWLAEDGGFTPLRGHPARIPALQRDLSGAFLRLAETWQARDRPGFEAAAEAVWENREGYAGQSLDGMAIPDYWLGVFLNRLGLPLGRLYEETTTTRIKNRTGSEASLLVAALGMVGAERAWAGGDTAAAAERAGLAAMVDPANHAATAMTLLCDLKQERALESQPAQFADYPWHLPRVLALLVENTATDSQLAEGKLHAVYLRFVQRMRDSRPLLSPSKVPAGAARYLAWKLGIPAASDGDSILDRLRQEELLLTDAFIATRLIAEPILAALKAPSV